MHMLNREMSMFSELPLPQTGTLQQNDCMYELIQVEGTELLAKTRDYK